MASKQAEPSIIMFDQSPNFAKSLSQNETEEVGSFRTGLMNAETHINSEMSLGGILKSYLSCPAAMRAIASLNFGINETI